MGDPRHSQTLVELLRRRAEQSPDQIAYRFLNESEDDTQEVRYGELDAISRAIAARVATLTKPGDRAILVSPTHYDFVTQFFGCLYAGVVPVPVYPPNPTRPERSLPKFVPIVLDAQPSLVLTTGFIAGMAQGLAELAPEIAHIPWHGADEVPASEGATWREPALRRDSLAFLQYTSGSTGAPKGVMVTHGNILRNEELIFRGFGFSTGLSGAGWLPLYHDMGLIGFTLQPLYSGITVTLMSPLHFLQRPMRWLQAVSRYKANITGAPNFAFEYVLRSANETSIQGLDLSSLTHVLCGAEVVRAETLERFTETFAPAGFKRGIFFPCYGLAEATLMVTSLRTEGQVNVLSMDRSSLEEGRPRTSDEARSSARLVSCGAPVEQRVEIVDPESRRAVPPGNIGEIWVSGPCVAAGYWQKPQETAETFQATLEGEPQTPFLRTGDLGFFHGGELYVTGRIKDLIIINGRNHSPTDIELSVEKSSASLRPGCVAAFSVDVNGEEKLVVAAETERRYHDRRKAQQPPPPGAVRREGDRREPQVEDGASPPVRVPFDKDECIAAIREVVSANHQLQVHEVVLVKTGGIPRTSSGKVQRRACRTQYLKGTLERSS